jgi:hypothetical protein
MQQTYWDLGQPEVGSEALFRILMSISLYVYFPTTHTPGTDLCQRIYPTTHWRDCEDISTLRER